MSLVLQWSPSSVTNKMAGLTFFVYIGLAVLASNIVLGTVNHVPLPTINLTEWWGSGNASSTKNKTISNFSIHFNTTMISDLRRRLDSHRTFRSPLEGVALNYGFNSTTLKTWIKYLSKEYPFETRVKFLNKYSHFQTIIQGLKIHFMRVQSQNTTHKAIPLLLLHGWPGSVREFYEAIPYLLSKSEDKGLAFDIIVPSLPGFGFSDGAAKPGMGVDKVAVVLRNLMNRIGHSAYYVHGGGLGAMIGAAMATLFPNEVLGYHSTYALYHTPDIIFRLIMASNHTEEVAAPAVVPRLYPLIDTFLNITTATGYLHQLATKPDTVGIVTSDSPSALMSYTFDRIAMGTRQKFINETDGGLTKIFTKEQLCDNLVIYWSTNCMTTAGRLYAETFNKRYYLLRLNEIKTPVPIWVLQTPDSMIYLPPWMIQLKFPNFVNETLPSEGGLFFAWEKPKLFAEDVVDAVVAFKKWHKTNSTLYADCSSFITN